MNAIIYNPETGAPLSMVIAPEEHLEAYASSGMGVLVLEEGQVIMPGSIVVDGQLVAPVVEEEVVVGRVNVGGFGADGALILDSDLSIGSVEVVELPQESVLPEGVVSPADHTGEEPPPLEVQVHENRLIGLFRDEVDVWAEANIVTVDDCRKVLTELIKMVTRPRPGYLGD